MSALAPRRAPARIAWRQARRAPWRSALIVAMVALPIMALSLGVILIRTVIPTPAERATELMGSADLMIAEWYERPSLEELRRTFPHGTKLVPQRTRYTQNIIGGTELYLPIHEYPVAIDRAPVRGMFRLTSGRAPVGTGEVAVHQDALELAGVAVGETIELGDAGLKLRVTGTVARPAHLHERVAVAGPGTLRGEDVGADALLIDVPAGASVAGVRHRLEAAGVLAQTRAEPSEGDQQARIVAGGTAFAGAALALFGTGLIAAAAFVVGAKRQLRTLGLVGSAGGEPRHVRAVVAMGGVSLGLVGSLVGVGLGIGLAFALRPKLDLLMGREVGAVEVPVLPLALAVALGTAAAALAAYGPARAAARLPTVAALAGRAATPRPPGRLARRGLVVLLIGVALTAWGNVTDGTPVVTAGLFAMLMGFLLAIPLLAASIGRVAHRLPATARLAARDVARHGRRSGAALAAAAIVLALPIAVAASSLSDEAFERRIAFMGDDHLLAIHHAPGDDRERDRAAFVADLHDALPGSTIVRLRAAVYRDALVRAEGTEVLVGEGATTRESGPLLIGGPELLRAYHAENGSKALEEGKVVTVGPDSTDGGGVRLLLGPGGRETRRVAAVSAGASRYASLGLGGLIAIVSPDTAASLGLRPSEHRHLPDAQWVVRAAAPLDDDDLSRARAAAARHPGAVVISERDLGSDASPVRLVVTVAAGILALAVVGVVVALVGAESRRDHAILVAVGASPSTRRKVVGINAWLLATLGGALAVTAGFLPVVVIQLAREAARPVVVPWATMAVALVVVPLVAAVGAAAVSRQPRAVQMLRPLA